MSKEVMDFYRGRIEASHVYGFKVGHDILKMVTRCAFWDSLLTGEEFNTIIILCEKAHIKMMEDNYNAGWNE